MDLDFTTDFELKFADLQKEVLQTEIRRRKMASFAVGVDTASLWFSEFEMGGKNEHTQCEIPSNSQL